MTSDSSSIREGLVWAREANGCVSHTCSVPFTAWTRENVSVREEASSILIFKKALFTIVRDLKLYALALARASFRTGVIALTCSCRLPVIIYQWLIFMCTPCTLPSTPMPCTVTRSRPSVTPGARISADGGAIVAVRR